jgi:adenosylcobinamide-phosphate synthase
LPAAAAYRAANTLDALWGYRDSEFEQLGKTAARLDDVLNLVPARVTALAIILAARALPRRQGFDARGALEVWRADRGRTASPNAGHPMAAMAGALGVRLEKQGDYVLGASRRPPVAADIERAVTLGSAAARLVGAGLLVALLLSEVQR